MKVGDSVKTLKIPHTLCLIHMNRKGTIKRGIFQVGACTNLKYFMEKNHLSGLDFAQIAPGVAICLYYDTLDWNA